MDEGAEIGCDLLVEGCVWFEPAFEVGGVLLGCGGGKPEGENAGDVGVHGCGCGGSGGEGASLLLEIGCYGI